MPTLTWNLAAVVRDLKAIGRQAPAAMSKALNRTTTAVRTAAQRSVREELNLKARDVSKLMRVRRATARDLGAELRIKAKPEGLIVYGARQVKLGVSVKVKRKGPRKVIRHAFIAVMRSGHRGVFTRRRKGRNAGFSARLPIRELFSVAVVQHLNNELVLARLHRVARMTFEKTIDHEIQFRLAKQRLAA